MTTKITNSAGVTLSGLTISVGQEVGLRVYPGEKCTDLLINSTRADFGEIQSAPESDGSAAANGQELVTSGILEGSADGLSWSAINGFDNAIRLGGLSEDDGYKNLWVRISNAVEPQSIGTIPFGIAIRIQLVPDEPYFDFDVETGTILGFGEFSAMPDTITLPSQIEGIAVVAVAAEAFKLEEGPDTIIVPESILDIGDEAFIFETSGGLSTAYFYGMTTAFGENVFGEIGSQLDVYCYSGSDAEAYAEANDHSVILLPSLVWDFNETTGYIDGLTFAGYDETGDLVIPERINDIIVQGVSENAFSGIDLGYYGEGGNVVLSPDIAEFTIEKRAFVGALNSFYFTDEEGVLLRVGLEAFKDTEIEIFKTTSMTTIFSTGVFNGTSVLIVAYDGSTAIDYAIENDHDYELIPEE